MKKIYYNKRNNGIWIFRIIGKIIYVFIVATISISLYDLYRNINVDSAENTELKKEEVVEVNSKDEVEVYEIIEDVSNAVVGISKLQSIDVSFFSLEAAKTYNLGTGIIISKDGYMITNNHITGDIYSKCYITLKDGTELTGNVVWTDEYLDLSIIKIETTRELNYCDLGDSDGIKVGQTVFAIGNPLGIEFQRTVTSGIISATERTIKIEEEKRANYMEDLIQTDASINSGNSGGPLIDKSGKVLGITTVKIKEAEGIGFAIPINVIKPIIKRFSEEKQFEEPSIGIYGYDKEAVQYIDSSFKIETGIYVSDLVIGGAAKRSGIQVGDVIEQIDGIELNKLNDLRKYIYTKNIGEEVRLMVKRNNVKKEIILKLMKK